MNQPKVSVIVPVYKVEKYLVQCVESILAQTLKEIEIILIDEGDKDACRIIIDYYAKIDNRIIAIHEKNGGYGASCNKGFMIARGEYIGIVESDDFIDSHMYEEMYNYAKKYNVDILKTPYYEYFDKTSKEEEIIKKCPAWELLKKIPNTNKFSVIEYPIFFGIHPCLWSSIYRTDFIKEKNIKFDEEKGSGYVDQTFRVLSLCHANSIYYLHKPYYYYRLSNPDASTANDYNMSSMVKRWENVHELIEKNFKTMKSAIEPYLIREEFVCTFEKVYYAAYPIDYETCISLLKNMQQYSYNSILKSNLLTRDQKKDIVKMLEYPDVFYKKCILNFEIKKIKHNLPFFKIKKNFIRIQILRWIPISIFNLSFNILSFTFIFQIGKERRK